MPRSLMAAMMVAAGTGYAAADDQAIPLGRYQPEAQGFGAGVVTPGSETITGDTETVGWHRYRPFVWGYRPYYAPFSYGFYRPGFSYSFYSYSYPRFYYPPVVYSYPVYPTYNWSYGYSSYYPGGWCGIGLKEKLGVAASVVDLALRAKAAVADARQPEPQPFAFPQAVPGGQPVPQPAAPASQLDDRFRYDGGPANPVPMPTPDSRPAPSPASPPAKPAVDDPGTVQISLPVKPSAYRYRAYGEK